MNCPAAVYIRSICASCFNILLCFYVTNKNSYNKNALFLLEFSFFFFFFSP